MLKKKSTKFSITISSYRWFKQTQKLDTEKSLPPFPHHIQNCLKFLGITKAPTLSMADNNKQYRDVRLSRKFNIHWKKAIVLRTAGWCTWVKNSFSKSCKNYLSRKKILNWPHVLFMMNKISNLLSIFIIPIFFQSDWSYHLHMCKIPLWSDQLCKNIVMEISIKL